MLLLLTALAMAQDPAPETEEQTSTQEEAPAPAPDAAPEAAPEPDQEGAKIAEESGWSADPVDVEPADTEPAKTETAESGGEPAEAGTESLESGTEPPEAELGEEIGQAPKMPMPSPEGAQVPPALQGTYEEGYEAGTEAAELFADWVQPAVAGAGYGAGIAGAGVFCGGLVCGAPAVLGGAGYQAYKTRKDVPAPPPGAWQERSAEFQTGFIQGFQARASRKRTRWALAGGATGAIVGTGVGLVVVSALYNRQGRDFI